MSHLGLGIQGSREDKHEELMAPFDTLSLRDEAQYQRAVDFLTKHPNPLMEVGLESVPIVLTDPLESDISTVGIVSNRNMARYSIYAIDSKRAMQIQFAGGDPEELEQFYDDESEPDDERHEGDRILDFVYKPWAIATTKFRPLEGEQSLIVRDADDLITGNEFSPLARMRIGLMQRTLGRELKRVDKFHRDFVDATVKPGLNPSIAIPPLFT